jgi:hypothetical protein
LIALDAIDLRSQLISMTAWDLAAIVAALLSIGIVWGMLRKTIRASESSVKDLKTDVMHLRDLVGAIALREAECRQSNAVNFASRGELSRMVADSTEQYQRIGNKIDALGEAVHNQVSDVHSRVTTVGERLANIEGKLGVQNT